MQKKMKKTAWVISITCISLIVLRIIWKDLNFDTIGLLLLLIGFSPWFVPIIKSVELPGGYKVELRKIENALEKIDSIKHVSEPLISFSTLTNISQQDELLDFNTIDDPNRALIFFRFEVERILIDIIKATENKPVNLGTEKILDKVAELDLIPSAVLLGISELVELSNLAIHGYTVPSKSIPLLGKARDQLINSIRRH
jgi:hypothetical protein